MGINYLKISIRNLKRQPLYTLLTISGLAIGVASFITIASFVEYHLSFDRYHEKAANIYRLTSKTQFVPGAPPIEYALSQAKFAPVMESQFSQVLNSARLAQLNQVSVLREGRAVAEKGVFLADSTLFDVFTVPLIAGTKQTALANPRSVVITREVSEKYFGSSDALNKELTLSINGTWMSFAVSGIVESAPPRSHFHFNILLPFQNLSAFGGGDDSWCYTYLLLQNEESAASLQDQLHDFAEAHVKREAGSDFQFVLQPLTDIHLRSRLRFELEENGSMRDLYIFSSVAILILFLASLNFTSLMITSNLRRNREVGIRKAIGASRRAIVFQFLAESVVVAGGGALAGLLLAELSSPWLGDLLGNDGVAIQFGAAGAVVASLVVVLSTIILASIYPIYHIAAVEPWRMLKTHTAGGYASARFRKGIIIVQFTASVGLIIATVVIQRQFSFMRAADVGYDRDALFVAANPFGRAYDVFKTGALQNTGVVNVTAASYVPGQIPGSALVKEPGTNTGLQMKWVSVDESFFETLGIPLVQGKSRRGKQISRPAGFVLNQAAIEALGWNSWDDRVLIAGLDTGIVTGVVKDVHFSSLRQKIEPMVFWNNPKQYYNVLIKLNGNKQSQALQAIEHQWQRLAPSTPFEYRFLSQDTEKLYQAEGRLGFLVALFAGLSIVIASLGLYALASYVTDCRTKEFGIRKVLGASAFQVLNSAAREFVVLVLVANLVSWPITFLVMNKWLEEFAYRREMSLELFLASGAAVLMFALVVVGSRARRAVRLNPVEALRYE